MSANGDEPRKHTIAVLVENKFGVLSRVAGLFSARGYNIESLSVGETLDPTVSRMTLVVRGRRLRHRAGDQAAPQAHRRHQGDRPQRGEPRRARDAAHPGQRRAGSTARRSCGSATSSAPRSSTSRPSPITLEVTGEEGKIEAHHRAPAARSASRRWCAPGKVAIARGPKTRLRQVEEKLGKQRGRAAAGRRSARSSASRTNQQTEKGRLNVMPAKIYYDQDADLGLLRARRSRSSATAARGTPTP